MLKLYLILTPAGNTCSTGPDGLSLIPLLLAINISLGRTLTAILCASRDVVHFLYFRSMGYFLNSLLLYETQLNIMCALVQTIHSLVISCGYRCQIRFYLVQSVEKYS